MANTILNVYFIDIRPVCEMQPWGKRFLDTCICNILYYA